jgi:hypothetical protein
MSDTTIDTTIPGTPAEAQAKLADLAGNKEFGARLLNGDTASTRLIADLAAVASTSDARLAAAISGSAERPEFEFVTGGLTLTTGQTMSAVQAFRELGISDGSISRLLKKSVHATFGM